MNNHDELETASAELLVAMDELAIYDRLPDWALDAMARCARALEGLAAEREEAKN